MNTRKLKFKYVYLLIMTSCQGFSVLTDLEQRRNAEQFLTMFNECMNEQSGIKQKDWQEIKTFILDKMLPYIKKDKLKNFVQDLKQRIKGHLQDNILEELESTNTFSDDTQGVKKILIKCKEHIKKAVHSMQGKEKKFKRTSVELKTDILALLRGKDFDCYFTRVYRFNKEDFNVLFPENTSGDKIIAKALKFKERYNDSELVVHMKEKLQALLLKHNRFPSEQKFILGAIFGEEKQNQSQQIEMVQALPLDLTLNMLSSEFTSNPHGYLSQDLNTRLKDFFTYHRTQWEICQKQLNDLRFSHLEDMKKIPASLAECFKKQRQQKLEVQALRLQHNKDRINNLEVFHKYLNKVLRHIQTVYLASVEINSHQNNKTLLQNIQQEQDPEPLVLQSSVLNAMNNPYSEEELTYIYFDKSLEKHINTISQKAGLDSQNPEQHHETIEFWVNFQEKFAQKIKNFKKCHQILEEDHAHLLR
ncbi:hypothetical protein [Holospora curviuscula]|nr:hypothetical protein [Holospora curviuscula]